MGKTIIPWATYSLNPVKGLCPVDCKDLEGKPYCYARKMYKRFKWASTVRFMGKIGFLNQVLKIPRGNFERVFMGSTMELFGAHIKNEWMREIFEVTNAFPFFNFIFLTKKPWNLHLYSPYPDHFAIGVSTCTANMAKVAVLYLAGIKARTKFLSVEPFLEDVDLSAEDLRRAGVSWVIIGSRTQPVRHPPEGDVRKLINVCREAKAAVFVKPPLSKTRPEFDIQEFPETPLGG